MSEASDLHFSNNYHDLCQQHGTGAGFQFEFYCQCCSDTWRSPFEPYRSGQASGWMQQASGLLSGLLGSMGSQIDNAAEGLARAGWGTARDDAFRHAIAAAQAHFHRCAHCHSYVCERCWNIDSGLCQRCAPDLAAEIQTAKHAGTIEVATQQARLAGNSAAANLDTVTSRQLVCPSCNAETRGAKFCPQCGHNLAAPANCRACNHTLPAGSRFCPECGQGVAA
ncbi:zinc ribbon domain-containing protein [Dyella choica]|uniref:Zinc ribbon domain-containing protein n=1 Tax=Dyella choica TaxID=1927959 RepID=A0A3S0S0C3_9GAMM|nr:zinc ribbon domain-containing protein [Dyella choica]RUL75424.1 zinc ribbon domain-containing protein [Dyella choica]